MAILKRYTGKKFKKSQFPASTAKVGLACKNPQKADFDTNNAVPEGFGVSSGLNSSFSRQKQFLEVPLMEDGLVEVVWYLDVPIGFLF